jgi:DNA excision repair protein ERCC-2
MIPESLRKNAIVVFDEAHNIDDVCIEAYEVKINRLVLDQSSKNLNRLKQSIDANKETDLLRLE